VVREVVRQGARLAVVGTAVGIALAAGAMWVAAGSPHGIRLRYPRHTYVVTSLLVLLVALAGAYDPARRAWRIDPIAARRLE
jgi:hypothetical protein